MEKIRDLLDGESRDGCYLLQLSVLFLSMIAQSVVTFNRLSMIID